jgi:hypothetical protein
MDTCELQGMKQPRNPKMKKLIATISRVGRYILASG